MPPLSDQKFDQDAQWSPKPKKFCFCVIATARPLCVPQTSKTAVVSQQVVQRRQSGGRTIVIVAQLLPWSPNGGTVVATVVAQWTLLVGQRRHSGGTREAEVSLKLIHNVYNCTNYLTGRPMADPGTSILRPRRCVCLSPASFERPVSDRPPWRPLCDCFEHAQNFTATVASMARSERPLRHPWTTKATFLLPLCLQRRPDQFCGRTREAQRSRPLCKGGNTTVIFTYLGNSHRPMSWWHHIMEIVSALLAVCEGNPPGTGGFPSQRTGNTGFDVTFDVSLNKRLNKPSSSRWFGTPWGLLWRHCIRVPQSIVRTQNNYSHRLLATIRTYIDTRTCYTNISLSDMYTTETFAYCYRPVLVLLVCFLAQDPIDIAMGIQRGEAMYI